MAGQALGVVPIMSKHSSERTPQVPAAADALACPGCHLGCHLAVCPALDVGHLALGCHLAVGPALDVGHLAVALLLFCTNSGPWR